MALRATPVVVLLVAVVLAPLSAGAPALTPDQQLVAGLETANGASRAALRSLAQPSALRATKAAGELRRAAAAVDAAAKVAPRAVGALDNRSMRTALQQGRALTRQAASDVAKGRYAAARAKIRQAVALKTAALREFGAPLRRDFQVFAVNRDFRNVPIFNEYSGLTATASEEVVEIIIGAANRTTAKAEGSGAPVGASPGLPIAVMSHYQIQDPIGAYTSNRCSLDAGLISCPLAPTLRPQHSFTIAFAPKLARGTEILVKFRAAGGRSSYAVFATR